MRTPVLLPHRPLTRLPQGIVRILCVATKAPWPPIDGGRLAFWQLLNDLARRGHSIALVAPAANHAPTEHVDALRAVCEPYLIAVASRSLPTQVASSVLTGTALSVTRHTSAEMTQAVANRVRVFRPDVIHVEQLQALANCRVAVADGVPLLLRMQNVESELWTQVAQSHWKRRPMQVESMRLKRAEQQALVTSDAVTTLTERDSDTFRSWVNQSVAARIQCIAPTFAEVLPSAAPVLGTPALALSGSTGWWPNAQGGRWFFDSVWPSVHRAMPGAHAHIFGGEPMLGPNVHSHSAPADSIDAFPANAIAVVPLHVASGIRMRILEAWARGLPVIATSVAARGLAVHNYQELVIADTPQQFVDALHRLTNDVALRAHLIAHGRTYLRRHHDENTVTQALIERYSGAIQTATLRRG
jgi:polysaccharide biosynthesis protein PslH